MANTTTLNIRIVEYPVRDGHGFGVTLTTTRIRKTATTYIPNRGQVVTRLAQIRKANPNATIEVEQHIRYGNEFHFEEALAITKPQQSKQSKQYKGFYQNKLREWTETDEARVKFSFLDKSTNALALIRFAIWLDNTVGEGSQDDDSDNDSDQ